jgi:malonyl-CoA/methylmalonyl-CoA synthetase
MTPHFLHELRTAFADRADHPAVLHAGGSLTYAELQRRVNRCAAFLRAQGLGRGDRVILLTPAKIPFLLAHLGVLQAGAISVPLNPRFTREELRHFLTDSGATLAVAGPDQRPLLEALRADAPALRAVLADSAVADATEAEWHEPDVSPDDPCLMIYSSGTTGLPKGVVHTNANLSASLRALADCWRFTPDDVVVNVLPLFHIHGLSFATHMTLLTGGTVHIEESFDAAGTLDVVGRGTVFMAVPTIYYRFLEQQSFAEKARAWGRVRLFTCGSAPIRPDVLPQLESTLGRPVINRYGMTEAHVITSLPLDGPWPAGSVGLPLSGIELRVVRPDGRPTAAGETGAVLVRGPNLFREYWNNPEATRKAFASGWFDTGDLGHLDDRGFLTLDGRSNDLIITSGYNVYPQVVERAVNECPGVRESAVVGVPDATRGEAVAAFVVRDDPALDEGRLLAFLSDRLIDYQRPRRVQFVDALPRNAMGKVLRKDLAKLAADS